MAGLFDDHPLVWAFLELSPDVRSHTRPPLTVSRVFQHAQTAGLWIVLSIAAHTVVHGQSTQHLVELNLQSECPYT